MSADELELVRLVYEDAELYLPQLASYLEQHGEEERARYLRARLMLLTQDEAYIANKNNLRGYLVSNRDRCPCCGRRREILKETVLNTASRETTYLCSSCGVMSTLVGAPPVVEGCGSDG